MTLYTKPKSDKISVLIYEARNIYNLRKILSVIELIIMQKTLTYFRHLEVSKYNYKHQYKIFLIQ